MSFHAANRARKHAHLPRPPELIPGAAPPARRKRALSWTSAENDFAAWLIKTWNETVGPVAGRCYHTRRNNFNAIQLYRRLHAPQGETRSSTSLIFSSDAIRRALAAYAEQARSIEPQFWLTFQGWCKNAEDHISRQLTRLGIPADHDAARKAAALALTEHLGLVREARAAARDGETLPAHFAHQLRAADRARPSQRQQMRDHYIRLSTLAFELTKLDLTAKRTMHKQACEAFRAAFDRDPNPAVTREDGPVVHALALALYDVLRRRISSTEAAP